MKAEMVDPAALKPHPRNSRTHDARQISAIGRSLQKWGFRQPIVANQDGVVLIGHGRLEAAKAIGLKLVPVVFIDIDPDRERALIISDNRMAELSKWDQDTLGDELRWLMESGFDLTLTTKDLPEFAPVREAEPADPVEPVSVQGDIWTAGGHVIICGDGSKPGPLAAAAAFGEPAIALTTAPKGGAPGEAEDAVARALAAAVAPIAYVWHEARQIGGIGSAMEAVGYDLRAQIVLARSAAKGGGNGRYASQYDPCWYGVLNGKTASWRGGRSQSTLWREDDGLDSPAVQRGRALRRPITSHTEPGGRVFDPFAGKGDVLIAAHFAGRTCTAIEADPRAVDGMLARWEIFSGKDVKHASGKTFAEVREGRAAA